MSKLKVIADEKLTLVQKIISFFFGEKTVIKENLLANIFLFSHNAFKRPLSSGWCGKN